MALDKGKWVPFGHLLQVTGTEHHLGYAAHRGKLLSGCDLSMEADFDNPKDRWATKVLCDGVQIGWIWRKQNADMWHDLRESGYEGYKMRLIVTHHNRYEDTFQRLQARLEVFHPAVQESESMHPGSTFKPWAQCGAPSNRPDAYLAMKKAPHGATLELITKEGRITTTVLHRKSGGECWVRHADLPEDFNASTWSAHKVGGGLVFLAPAKDSPRGYVGGTFFSGPLGEPVKDVEDRWPLHENLDRAEEEMIAASTQYDNQKENIMSLTSQATALIDSNKSAAQQAAYLEAGRIANNKAAQLAGKGLPLMLRGYADTPVGRLVLANLATVAAQQLRPQDPTLRKLTSAMTVAAYQEVIASFDIEGYIDGLLESPDLKRAVSKLGEDDPLTGGRAGN